MVQQLLKASGLLLIGVALSLSLAGCGGQVSSSVAAPLASPTLTGSGQLAAAQTVIAKATLDAELSAATPTETGFGSINATAEAGRTPRPTATPTETGFGSINATIAAGRTPRPGATATETGFGSVNKTVAAGQTAEAKITLTPKSTTTPDPIQRLWATQTAEASNTATPQPTATVEPQTTDTPTPVPDSITGVFHVMTLGANMRITIHNPGTEPMGIRFTSPGFVTGPVLRVSTTDGQMFDANDNLSSGIFSPECHSDSFEKQFCGFNVFQVPPGFTVCGFIIPQDPTNPIEDQPTPLIVNTIGVPSSATIDRIYDLDSKPIPVPRTQPAATCLPEPPVPQTRLPYTVSGTATSPALVTVTGFHAGDLMHVDNTGSSDLDATTLGLYVIGVNGVVQSLLSPWEAPIPPHESATLHILPMAKSLGVPAAYIISWPDQNVWDVFHVDLPPAGQTSAQAATAPASAGALHYTSKETFLYVADAAYGYTGVNMRVRPDINAKLISFIPNGSRIKVLGQPILGSDREQWYKATSGKISGFVRAKFLSHKAPPATTSLIVDAAGQGFTGVNLRSQPTTKSDLEMLIPNGEIIPMVLGTTTDSDGATWYRVVYSEREGYVHSSLVKPVGH